MVHLHNHLLFLLLLVNNLVPKLDAFAPRSLKHSASLGTSNTPVTSWYKRNVVVSVALGEDNLWEKFPSQPVIDAVQSSPNNRVMASDVSVSAGVSLSQARRDLTLLASLSRGDIAVSADGDLVYSFPKDITSVLARNSLRFKLNQIFSKIKPVLFYALRVSFGIALLASLIAIFSTILFISSSTSDDREERRRDRRMDFGIGGYWGSNPFDFFYYRPYYGYFETPFTERTQSPEEMGFLESIFSYLFGDGNPNQDFDARRLSLAANMIRRNNGAVTAEQLAPFCDDLPVVDDGSGRDNKNVDESFVLPIVTKLDGEPRVTEGGDIVYVFPELQLSASMDEAASSVLLRAGLPRDATSQDIRRVLSVNGIDIRGAYERRDLIDALNEVLPKSTLNLDTLEEAEYKFSVASPINRFLAGGLGVLNLVGALYLENMFSSAAMYGVRLPGYYGAIQTIFPLLLGYAILYNAIPIARWFWIRKQNAIIQDRNERRTQWKEALHESYGRIASKLADASRLGKALKTIKQEEIVYDTNQSAMDTSFDKEENELGEFDRKLKESTD